MIDYAKKHGYDLYIDYETNNDRGMMWHKFDMVQKVINASEHDWVWWMDFDTLITNTNTKLEDIISESLANATDPDLVDYIFTPDWYVDSLPSDQCKNPVASVEDVTFLDSRVSLGALLKTPVLQDIYKTTKPSN